MWFPFTCGSYGSFSITGYFVVSWWEVLTEELEGAITSYPHYVVPPIWPPLSKLLWLRRPSWMGVLPLQERKDSFCRATFHTYKHICHNSLKKIHSAIPSLHKIASLWPHSWGKFKLKRKKNTPRNHQKFIILLFWLVSKNNDDLQLAWLPPAVGLAPGFQRFGLPGWPADMLHHFCNSQIRRYFMHVLYLFKHMSIHNIN